MFTLSTKADYGFLLLSLIFKKESVKTGSYISIAELSLENGLPHAFMSRIASELKAARILNSKEGISGGYKLAKKPNKISVGEIVEIFDGPITPTKCACGDEKCKYEKKCSVGIFWKTDFKGQIMRILKSYTLEDLVKSRN